MSGSKVGDAPTVSVHVDVGSGLPFTPVTLVFRDLKYFVPNPAKVCDFELGRCVC